MFEIEKGLNSQIFFRISLFYLWSLGCCIPESTSDCPKALPVPIKPVG